MPTEIDIRQLVVFQIGEEQYALPIDRVQEIIRFVEPRSVASTIEGARGVISLRGRIVPVYDIAARLGAIAKGGEEAKIVIVGFGDETAGVIVDSVDEVLKVSGVEIEVSDGFASGAIDAVVRRGDALVALLSIDRLYNAAAAAGAE